MTASESNGRRWTFRVLALAGGVALALLAGEGVLRIQRAMGDRSAETPELGWARRPSPPLFQGDCATQPEQAALGDILWPTDDLDMVYGLIPELDTCFRGIRVRTSPDGLRGGASYAVPRPPGVARMLLLGDSQAFGWGVAERHTVGARLEGEIARRSGAPVEVINAAVPGYNTFQQAALLEARGMAYQPDCVLVLFTANDLALPFFLLKDVAVSAWSGSLLLARLERLAGSKRWFEHASEDLLGYVEEVELERVPERYRHMVGIEGYRAAWERMLRAAGDVQVVNVADLSGVKPELAHEIAAVHAELGVAHLPLTWPVGERFQLDPLSDPHPTPVAHRRFARELARALAENRLCDTRP